MRFIPASIIVLLASGLSPLAQAGPVGLHGLTVNLHEQCSLKTNAAVNSATVEFVSDSREMSRLARAGEEIPARLETSRKLNRAKVALEKTKCLHAQINILYPQENVARLKRFNSTLIRQLELFVGLKSRELSNTGMASDCQFTIKEEQAACIDKKQTVLVQEGSVLDSVKNFLSGIENSSNSQTSLNELMKSAEAKIATDIKKWEAEMEFPEIIVNRAAKGDKEQIGNIKEVSR